MVREPCARGHAPDVTQEAGIRFRVWGSLYVSSPRTFLHSASDGVETCVLYFACLEPQDNDGSALGLATPRMNSPPGRRYARDEPTLTWSVGSAHTCILTSPKAKCISQRSTRGQIKRATALQVDMRALRNHGAKDLRVDDVPEPQCLDHQVKVKPAFCGICGTDLHEYTKPTFTPVPGSPHPVTNEVTPVGVGHEFSGEVVEVGSKVQRVKVGDKVAVQPTICCWDCPPCKGGYLNCCDSAGFVGLSGWGGGMADFVCVDGRFVFPLPENIPLQVGGR